MNTLTKAINVKLDWYNPRFQLFTRLASLTRFILSPETLSSGKCEPERSNQRSISSSKLLPYHCANLLLSVSSSFSTGGGSGVNVCLPPQPSLLQIKNGKFANREHIYDFLQGLGIIPDELDGVELPSDVQVIKERLDFLKELGFTIVDINNYPLVLGCSVKKNMIPVLDYLRKLGVHKSSLTKFLLRYPQILHASVMVDLQPVVNYLKGMDIKPTDIPQVLEKYPEVLGFKLEGTMSTSVAYLIGIGIGRKEIGGVLTRYPEILGMRVGKVIKPFVEYLESLGISRWTVARLLVQHPHILGFSLGCQVKPNVETILQSGVKEAMLESVLTQYPEIMGSDFTSKLCFQRGFLMSNLEIGSEEFGLVIERMPQVISLSESFILKHIDFLQNCGFSRLQVRNMVIRCPRLLAHDLDVMKLSFEYFRKEMGRDLFDLIEFPAFFTFELESTIKPRHKMVARKSMKYSLAWLLNCNDDQFAERMECISNEMAEMERDTKLSMEG